MGGERKEKERKRNREKCVAHSVPIVVWHCKDSCSSLVMMFCCICCLLSVFYGLAVRVIVFEMSGFCLCAMFSFSIEKKSVVHWSLIFLCGWHCISMSMLFLLIINETCVIFQNSVLHCSYMSL